MVTTAAGESGGRSSTRVVRRRWVRREPPVWPFVWRGLLPVLGLLLLAAYAVWPFARDEVQAVVWRETRSQLDAKGLGWVTVEVSGQDVTLAGVQPAAGAGDGALAVARAAACPSWAGPLRCAVQVTGLFSDPEPPPAPPPAVPEAAAVTPSPAPPAEAAVACERALADIVAQSKIEFATSSAAIAPRSAPVLNALARAARDCPGVIRIEGHTDARGTPERNRALSAARAGSVRNALVERGLPAGRLEVQGFGADRPLADNASAAGQARNRRIEFRVVTGND